jgi:histidine ammonia-lyase
MNEKPIVLNGDNLTIYDLYAVAKNDQKVELTSNAKKQIEHSAQIVKEILKEEKKVYGITTGFGYLQKISISLDNVEKLQENLITSHSAGVGTKLSKDIVRGMMLLQINKFARGHSGIRIKVVDYLLNFLNGGVTPVIPSQGSLGASGDLAPLAHLSSVLLGRGSVLYQGSQISGHEALEKIGKKPLKLFAKEGLALLNGTQAMTSIAAISLIESYYLMKIANIAVALSMDVHKGNIDCLNPLVHQARPHVGQMYTADTILNFLKGSKRVQQLIGHQDSYSLRCAPIVHGAVYDTLEHAKKVIEVEMNSSTDNPLIFSPDQVFSGGNFHGEPIALVLDFLAIALTELGNIAERRIERILNPELSNLPAFLAPESGLNSGMMITQYTAAALASENKQLATPASIDNISVSANQEDHVSMGMNSANKILRIISNLQNILAIELLCAIQAVDLAKIQNDISPECKKIYDIIRSHIQYLDKDRELSPDINKCASLIQNHSI